jgi:hypothetical protein
MRNLGVARNTCTLFLNKKIFFCPLPFAHLELLWCTHEFFLEIFHQTAPQTNKHTPLPSSSQSLDKDDRRSIYHTQDAHMVHDDE